MLASFCQDKLSEFIIFPVGTLALIDRIPLAILIYLLRECFIEIDPIHLSKSQYEIEHATKFLLDAL